jgi:hypothetical protein
MARGKRHASHRTASIVPTEQVGRSILTPRGQRIILDADLARIYGVTTKPEEPAKPPMGFQSEIGSGEPAAFRKSASKSPRSTARNRRSHALS